MTKIYAVRTRLRAPVHCPFCYFCDGVLANGMIWDLSEMGWRATGERPVTADAEMTVYLTLPDNGQSKNILIDAAVVRWAEDQDAGWEIIRIDEEARIRLNQFLDTLDATGAGSETKERTHSW